IASLLCGMAPSLGFLVVFRALQGATGGGLQPCGQAILTDAFPAEKRGMATALYGVAVMFAPAIGPTLGGWLTDNISWRMVFLINVPVGILLFLLVSALVRDPPQLNEARARLRKDGINFDYVGFGLIALGLGALQIVLDRGQEADWFGSTLITILIVASVLSLIALVVWELRRSQPIVDLRLLGNRTFAVSSGLMFMLGFMLLGSTYLIPVFVQELLGYTATDAGLAMTPGALMMMVLMPVIGRAVTNVDVRWLIAIGLLVCGGSLLLMTSFDLTTSYNSVMLARIYQSVGLAFLFIPINTAAFSELRPEQTTNASGLINLWRNLGGSIGISVASTLLTRRTQYHTSVLGAHIQTDNPAFTGAQQTLTAYFHHVIGYADAQHAMAVIAQLLAQQARLLSYLDTFSFLGVIFLALVPTVLLMRKVKGKPGVTIAH
ncbi:MAG: DHA2 family efflux MFS transporter permease subunit, partial [Rhizomicrobium sp.]